MLLIIFEVSADLMAGWLDSV